MSLALLAASSLFALPALLAAGPTCPKVAEPAEGAAVAKVDGKAITRAEIDQKLGQALCKARADYAQKLHELREQATNELVDERLLSAEAKKRGLKDAAALEAQLAASAPKPDEAMARQLYEENKDRVDGQPYEALRERIMVSLAQQGAQMARDQLLGSLRRDHKVEVTLEPIRFPVETKGPSRGPATAPVTIVMFADFQCPYCSRGADAVEEVRKRHGNEVRVIFKDYPLGFHEEALPSALAARCAGEQGKFWEMHDRLFEHQKDLGEDKLTEHAAAVGLDAERFKACMADPATVERVKRDTARGDALKIRGTPSWYINGLAYVGARSPEELLAIFERTAPGTGRSNPEATHDHP